MTVPAVTRGRGAWKIEGHDNGSRYYAWKGEALTASGMYPLRNTNYEAVHYGVRAIEQLAIFHKAAVAVPKGIFDAKVKTSVVVMQRKIGVADDGVAGPQTMRAALFPIIAYIGTAHCGRPDVIWGFCGLESGFDPGAVGVIVSPLGFDRGAFQINDVHGFTVAFVYDPIKACDYTSRRFGTSLVTFSEKGPELQLRCAIASHNSPKQARQWYEAGTPPSEQIRKYVELVLAQADTYPG